MSVKAALFVGAAVIVGGAAVGVAADQTGALSPLPEPSVSAHLDEVPYLECPDGDRLGELHRGDRVFATGRTDDLAWLEVRAPYDVATGVWVEAAWLTPDADLDALPVVSCQTDTAPAPTTTTTTRPLAPSTTLAGATTSTTIGPTSTTNAPTSTTNAPTTTSTTATTTTTTTVPDTTGPTISNLASEEAQIWEEANYGGCPTQVHTTIISASVSDPSGVGTVILGWEVGSASGSTPMGHVGSIYTAELGPFDDTTVSADEPIYLSVTAHDTVGNPTMVDSIDLVVLRNCTIA